MVPVVMFVYELLLSEILHMHKHYIKDF